jgi:hypothetical protein
VFLCLHRNINEKSSNSDARPKITFLYPAIHMHVPAMPKGIQTHCRCTISLWSFPLARTSVPTQPCWASWVSTCTATAKLVKCRVIFSCWATLYGFSHANFTFWPVRSCAHISSHALVCSHALYTTINHVLHAPHSTLECLRHWLPM